MRRPHVVLATSGLGNALGGIGVVAELIYESLEEFAERSIWHHDLGLGRQARLARMALASVPTGLQRPDFVVYDHVGLAALSVLLPWLWGVPYGVFVHGTEIWRPQSPLAKRTLLKASCIFANSSFTVAEARRHNPWFPQAVVTWLGVRKPTIRLDGAREARAVLVGRMDAGERQKGHDVVLDAWAAISAAVPGAELDVLGDGTDSERLKGRAASLKGVRFRGRVSDADRNATYATSSIFLFPSVQEGFGLAAVEAAAHGCPILVVRGTVYDELFPPGNGASFVDAPVPADVANVAAAVLADPAGVAEQSKRARARVEADFLDTHFKERFSGALQRILAAQ